MTVTSGTPPGNLDLRSRQTVAPDIPLGYLRTFLTLLVVAHHAALAYHPFAPPPPASLRTATLLWTAFPIVDPQKWPGAALFVGFNDAFFMSLMFLVSGVFAAPSLVRKSSLAFVRDRAMKLGVPFVVAASVLSPLAYYPSYLATGADAGLDDYLNEWLALGAWPAGPAWFLWVLMAFGTLAALAFRFAPRSLDTLGRWSEKLSTRSSKFFLFLIGAAAIAYLPMAWAFRPETWSNFGPFWAQTSRLLHYAVYFAFGLSLGAFGLNRGLLSHDGSLARRWPIWVFASLSSFTLSVIVVFAILATYDQGGHEPSPTLAAAGNLTFVLSCASSSLAGLAIFIRFARTPHPILDSLARNAYGIFLLHYVCVTFLQFAMLGSGMAGGLKMLTVFLGAVGISWALAAALRRIPLLARVI